MPSHHTLIVKPLFRDPIIAAVETHLTRLKEQIDDEITLVTDVIVKHRCTEPIETTPLLASFLNGEKPLESREQAVELMCTLHALVARSRAVPGFPPNPADCFCADGPERFLNDGEALRVIITTVLEVLAIDPTVDRVSIHNTPNKESDTP